MFQGKITIERVYFNPKLTLLEWHGPNRLYRSGHVLTENLDKEIPKFYQEILTTLDEEADRTPVQEGWNNTWLAASH